MVTGSMTFGNRAMNLKVPAGGVLAIFGDFTMNNKIEIENGGYLIVKGDINFLGGNDKISYTNTGMGGLYLGGTLEGTHTNDTMDQQKKALFELPEDLYNFIMQNPGSDNFASLPVELLYFTAQNTAEGVALTWASAREWDFRHYILE